MDFLYIWTLEFRKESYPLFQKETESTRYKDGELDLTEDRTGGEELLRPNMRPICYFSFFEDEGLKREQENSQRG